MLYAVEIIGIVSCVIVVRKMIAVLFGNRALITDLAANDLKMKYAGSSLGFLWAFVQPALTTAVYWFVFQMGFKSQPVENFPFILWLISGLTPWFYFGETILAGTGSIQEYAYLVKKVMFKVDILPTIKTISSFFVHIIFVSFVCVLFLVNGIGLRLYALQLVYYAIAMLIYATGLVYLFSALQVFIKDVIQIISAILQLVFWSVPIVWDISIMPETVQHILKLNPLFYIVEGYRDALINHIWFWEKMPQTIHFWFIALGIFAMGLYTFKRLTPHFADVL